jgi:oligopeptide/dipeptide ABC transporter ATP-binding protein
VVLYGGMLMEEGRVETIFANPRQPYTQALLACVPRLADQPGTLRPIDGQPPVAGMLGPGCPFAPRCPRVTARCPGERPPETPSDGHRLACWNPLP